MVHPGGPRGVFAAAVSPLNPDGRLNTPRLLDHCRWLLQQGCHGVSLFGTTGEGNSFTVSERRDALASIVAGGIDASRLMPALGSCASDDTIDLLCQATRLNCLGVLVAPPFYYKNVSDKGIIKSYADAIERVGDSRLRVYLYNIPQITGVTITPPIITKLCSDYPGTVCGLKDSSGDQRYAGSILDTFPDLNYFTGNEAQLPEVLLRGGAGSIGGIANIWPFEVRRLYDNWQVADACAIATRLEQVTTAVDTFAGISALKYVLGHYSGDINWLRTRPPLETLSKEQGCRLIAALEAVGYTPPVTRHAA